MRDKSVFLLDSLFGPEIALVPCIILGRVGGSIFLQFLDTKPKRTRARALPISLRKPGANS
jgi:hypothetical protein